MSQRCSAKNRNGKRCGAWAVRGGTQCALHSDPERAAEMGSKHGRKVTLLSRPDPLNLSHRPLKSAEEVCELLEETINRVRQGSLDLRGANTIGFPSGVQLKALAQRIEAPDTKIRRSKCLQKPISEARLGCARGGGSFRSIPATATTR
jgi:hypothetical protein